MRFQTHFQAGDRINRSQSTCNGTTALERSSCCDTIFGTIKRNSWRNQTTCSQCPIVHSSWNIRRELADCQNNGGTSSYKKSSVPVVSTHVVPGTSPQSAVGGTRKNNNNMATNNSRWNNNNNKMKSHIHSWCTWWYCCIKPRESRDR